MTTEADRGDSTRSNADKTFLDSGDKHMADEDFGDDTVPIESVEHIDTGLRRQDTTVLDQNPTTTQDRINGIIEQTRDDMLGRDREQIVELLSDRFRDSGIEISDDELETMAVAISRDRSQLPEGTFEEYREQVDPE